MIIFFIASSITVVYSLDTNQLSLTFSLIPFFISSLLYLCLMAFWYSFFFFIHSLGSESWMMTHLIIVLHLSFSSYPLPSSYAQSYMMVLSTGPTLTLLFPCASISFMLSSMMYFLLPSFYLVVILLFGRQGVHQSRK